MYVLYIRQGKRFTREERVLVLGKRERNRFGFRVTIVNTALQLERARKAERRTGRKKEEGWKNCWRLLISRPGRIHQHSPTFFPLPSLFFFTLGKFKFRAREYKCRLLFFRVRFSSRERRRVLLPSSLRPSGSLIQFSLRSQWKKKFLENNVISFRTISTQVKFIYIYIMKLLRRIVTKILNFRIFVSKEKRVFLINQSINF